MTLIHLPMPEAQDITDRVRESVEKLWDHRRSPRPKDVEGVGASVLGTVCQGRIQHESELFVPTGGSGQSASGNHGSIRGVANWRL